MAYTKTNWENSPSTNTPISDTNLNKIEQGIYDCSLITDTVGDVNNLKTDNKSSVVNAINELKDGDKYSSSEILTNKIWIDGKPIYRKYLNFSQSSTGDYTYTHNLNIDTVVNISALARISGQTISGYGYRPIPFHNFTINYHIFINSVKANTITTTSVGWTDNEYFIVLEYTKASE